ncbi:UNVERIFIED_ORG: hypothetical protein BDU10_5343 [Burkholderia sp. CF145]|uniref:hypothetical protein n=1 Tax=Paraburkholderia hospita TaxID=169430 RepID=UPI0002719C47|nr:hypothetical protein [Paraburkholderia hospita]EUC18711.1 hypothetical protein PMI06_003087 [Burkholderia sp. BT03]SKC62291.1 hypothetical protein SAMN06266956_1253 [Paraburkholderia hospita]
MTNLNVPEWFPRDDAPPVVSGTQPKVCARLSNGAYVVGQSDEEWLERWLICEDLARQLVAVAEKDALAHPEQSSSQTLGRVRASVARKAWVSPDELTWLTERLQQLLSW